MVHFNNQTVLIVMDYFVFQILSNRVTLVPLFISRIFVQRIVPMADCLVGIKKCIFYTDSLHAVGTDCFLVRSNVKFCVLIDLTIESSKSSYILQVSVGQ